MHSFQEHISNITRSSYFHLYNMNRLCPSHADYTLIDYFNSLLFGLALKSIHKLKLVQNFGACITRFLSISHITPVLQQLHWLPVNYCDDFKILLLTFIANPNFTLQYLHLLFGLALRCSASPLWNFLPPDISNINYLNFKILSQNALL